MLKTGCLRTNFSLMMKKQRLSVTLLPPWALLTPFQTPSLLSLAVATSSSHRKYGALDFGLILTLPQNNIMNMSLKVANQPTLNLKVLVLPANTLFL